MIFDFVRRQVREGRVRNGIRVRDDFTSKWLAFIRRCQGIEQKQIRLPQEIRWRIEALLRDTKYARSFRLMSRLEGKRAGGPRVVMEPSPELKKVMAQVDEYLAKPRTENSENDEKRARTVRAAMGLGSPGR